MGYLWEQFKKDEQQGDELLLGDASAHDVFSKIVASADETPDWCSNLTINDLTCLTGLGRTAVRDARSRLVLKKYIGLGYGIHKRPIIRVIKYGQPNSTDSELLPKPNSTDSELLPKPTPLKSTGVPVQPTLFNINNINNNIENNIEYKGDSKGGDTSRKPSPSYHITFNFETGSFDGITEKDVSRWQEAFPAIDVNGELKKMAVWLLSNPKNKKSNYPSFITRWLSKSQDRARPSIVVNGAQQQEQNNGNNGTWRKRNGEWDPKTIGTFGDDDYLHNDWK